MKLVLDLVEKVIEIEDIEKASTLHKVIDIIAERFVDFAPRIRPKKSSTIQIWQKLRNDDKEKR